MVAGLPTGAEEAAIAEYMRSTRECSLANMNPALAGALRAHAEKYNLGPLEAEALMCCETVSRKPKKGLFGKAETILTGVLLTPKWLVWAAGKENETPAVLSARLRDIRVQDYEQTSMHRLVPDSGLNVTGLRTDATDLGSAFIGLGPEPAARLFREKLSQALEKAGN